MFLACLKPHAAYSILQISRLDTPKRQLFILVTEDLFKKNAYFSPARKPVYRLI